jgi:hypothetical protein
VIDPALDGPGEVVKLRNDRAECPADSGAPAIRTEKAPSLHKQGLHERDRRIFECVVAVKETLDDRFTGQGFRPETIEGARVAQSFVGVGTLDHVREWSAACGACDPPSQSPMFWDCPGGSLARVPIRAGSADLRRPASADEFGRSRRQFDKRHRDERDRVTVQFF